jgi:hypothetical protein
LRYNEEMKKADRIVEATTNPTKRKALALLQSGAPRRMVVQQTGISAEALKQLAYDFGVKLVGKKNTGPRSA